MQQPAKPKTLSEAFGHFLLKGNWRAPLLALLFAPIPFLNWFSLVILGLVTLRKGALDGLWVLLWAMLPAVAYAFVGNAFIWVLNILGGAVFVWVMAAVLRRTASWLRVVQCTVVIGIVVVAIVHLVHPDIYVWWHKFLENMFTRQIEAAKKAGASVADAQKRSNFIATMKQSGAFTKASYAATGIMTSMTLVGSLIDLLIARWWQSYLFNPGGLRKEVADIRFAWPTLVALIACVLLALAGFTWFWDVLPFIALLFLVNCVTLMHKLAQLMNAGWLLLLFFYGLSILFFPFSMGVIIAIGLFDGLVNPRRWLIKTTDEMR